MTFFKMKSSLKELNIFFQADQDNIKSLLSKDFLTDEEAFKIMRSAKDVF